MHPYVANKNVFRNCLKLFPLIFGFHKLSGREFQELSWCRSTTRSCRVADRRQVFIAISYHWCMHIISTANYTVSQKCFKFDWL